MRGRFGSAYTGPPQACGSSVLLVCNTEPGLKAKELHFPCEPDKVLVIVFNGKRK